MCVCGGGVSAVLLTLVQAAFFSPKHTYSSWRGAGALRPPVITGSRQSEAPPAPLFQFSHPSAASGGSRRLSLALV